MSNLFRKYPVAAFYVVALLIGGVFSTPFIASALGLMPQIPFIIIFVAAFSATLAGIIVTGVISGGAGVKELLGRFLIWRFGLQWWAAVLLLPVVWWLSAMVLTSLLGGSVLDADRWQPLSFVIPYFLMKTIQAGVGEEFGWRGFALPRLQSRYNALAASIIVGVMHGFWHWPLYFVEGMGQYALRMEVGFLPAILLDTVMVTLWSIMYTWFYNNTKGSVLVAAILHGNIPVWALFFGIVGEGIGINLAVQFYYIGLVALTTVFILAIYGPVHLSRTTERQTA